MSRDKNSSMESVARNLCLADGFDPDERIPRLGAKPMPKWCTYIDRANAKIASLN